MFDFLYLPQLGPEVTGGVTGGSIGGISPKIQKIPPWLYQGKWWDDVGCSGWIMGNSMDKFIGPNPAMSAELMGRIGVTIPK